MESIEEIIELEADAESRELQECRRKRYKNNNATTKLQAIEWSRLHSITSAAKKFKVARKSIRDWLQNEKKLNQQINTTVKGQNRKRLDGGGRKVLHMDLEKELADWVKEMRERKLLVSRRIIRNKALEIFKNTDLKFMRRNNFVLRCLTTTCQHPPEDYIEAVAKFIVNVEQRRKEASFSEILAMDETAVWFDDPGGRCIESRGAKEVTVVTTGHEKMRITVCLSARSDGKKLTPYVLVKNKRPIPRIVQEFKGKLIINWAGSIWMNDETTEDYLRKIIGNNVFGSRRLLVWDTFGSHKSQSTSKIMRELKLEPAYVPGGCTKFIQPPDISWNKPFKEKIRHFYGIWMTNGDRREFTASGNPKPPSLDVVLDWVYRSWSELSKEVIVNSFLACGLSNPLDGSTDDKIACFKPDGPIGEKGLDVLCEMRARSRAADASIFGFSIL
uniref:HTH CENPB-type domain-containing protein n=1 Tax=Meloidogyne javanica TaxID=6303 RepID=A0A915MZS3_MELJA